MPLAMLQPQGMPSLRISQLPAICMVPEAKIHKAKKTGRVVTVEEHSVIGGLGSAVCDALCAKHPVPVKKLGMQDIFGESGSASALVEKYHLDGKGVYADIKDFLK